MPHRNRFSQLTMPVSEQRDHIRGPLDATITLVEYGDFECPHCGAAYPVLESVLESWPNEVRLVYRHFPLATVHPHAQHAAEASEAAAVQAAFWEMHDMLFENQDTLEDDYLVAYARDLGLDVPQFIQELRDGKHTARVREDFSSGIRSGVNGTPTLYFNGMRFTEAIVPDALDEAIQTELGHAPHPPRRRR